MGRVSLAPLFDVEAAPIKQWDSENSLEKLMVRARSVRTINFSNESRWESIEDSNSRFEIGSENRSPLASGFRIRFQQDLRICVVGGVLRTPPTTQIL